MIVKNYEKLKTFIMPNREAMGKIAAEAAIKALRKALSEKGEARIIVASAPSQNEVMKGLSEAEGIDWSQVTVFHMDEYVGLGEDHPASFRAYQKAHFLKSVTPRIFHGIRGEADDLDAEVKRYTGLFTEKPIDLVCMGIGENGHIAFNDPPVADFEDPATIKVVELDAACRQQQVNDGCFPDFDSVPTHALSLTCPALMSAGTVVCAVPTKLKAAAVKAALEGPLETSCPASILRRHPNAQLFIDSDAASLIETE